MSLTLDVALSMQIGLEKQVNVLTNNITKMKEPGSQEDIVVFAEFLSPDGQTSYMDPYATVRNRAQGSMQSTGNPNHAALIGEGYFGLQTPDGPRYTRNGAFMVDQEGRLIDIQGNAVMSQDGGDILIPNDAGPYSILQDGSVSTEQGILGRIGVFTFDNDYEVFHSEDGYLETEQAPNPSENTRVMGGHLEASNVDSMKTTSALVEANRLYSANQAFIEAELKRQDIANQTLLTQPSI